jgi:hypothetical protein
VSGTNQWRAVLLEYIAPLKSAVDILGGLLQLRGTTGDRAIFKSHVTPAYENMAKIVDDYLSMFLKLETAKNGLDDEAIGEFRRDRIKLRGLRIQIREICDVGARKPELDTFRFFFTAASGVFGDRKNKDTPSNFFNNLLDDSEYAWEQRHYEYYLQLLRAEIENHWQLLSREYARLKFELS